MTGLALGFLWAPHAPDDEAFRIFYVHVPIALTAYAFFGWGAWKALRLLWTGLERYDVESYTGVHIGVIFGVLTLVTGSIWARYTWGHWWTWQERQLVLFLILFLFYAAYFMLRFSIAAGPARARISAVYALFGVVLIPISFIAVRLAEQFVHPENVLTRDVGEKLATEQLVAFACCLSGMLALAATLYVNELRGKRIDARLRELREALT